MRHHTKKQVKPLSTLMAGRIFTLPPSMANDYDPKLDKPCLFVGINGNNTYIPIGEPTLISYDIFCVLKDLGILKHFQKYTDGEEFMPL